MEEFLKALAPWPLAQGIAIGLIIAAIGVWAIRKGLQDKRDREPAIETMKAEWAMREQLRHIHENSFEMVEHLKTIAAAMNRIADDRWNKRQ
jgi:hypothetical protein